MRLLSGVKRRAIGVALTEVLEHLGPDVCNTDYGKNLGQGLYEFRVDQDAEEILRKAGKDPRPEPEEARSSYVSSSMRTGRSSSSFCPGTIRVSTAASPTKTHRSKPHGSC